MNFLVLALTVIIAPLLAQHTPASHTLVVSVDGSKHPEQIPDELAYQHFIRAVAENAETTSEEKSRQLSRLARIQLSDPDTANLISILSKIKEKLDALGVRRARADSLTFPTTLHLNPELEQLKRDEDSLISTAIQEIRNSLTPDGWERLDAHIKDHVKSHIVIFTNP